MKKVLFAHQSTIPHYRVPFYNTLECLRPSEWSFDVVFDPAENKGKKVFVEPVDSDDFWFTILPARTITLKKSNPRIIYQTFLSKVTKYDLVILENAVNNLSYPLCFINKYFGTKIAFWGHDKDRSPNQEKYYKKLLEEFKRLLVKQADGFFAYTQGVKENLIKNGVQAENIYVVNNTIDINKHRQTYIKNMHAKELFRNSNRLTDKKVLLFVGRITSRRRLDLLYEAFRILRRKDDKYLLQIVGSGQDKYMEYINNGISYFGPIVDIDRLAPIYMASDLFIIPDSVGLAPLQAMCYDLPVVTTDSIFHGPEIEYLNTQNSVILNSQTTPKDLALAIDTLLTSKNKMLSFKASIWPSIEHLTIENMANRFINGINQILNT